LTAEIGAGLRGGDRRDDRGWRLMHPQTGEYAQLGAQKFGGMSNPESGQVGTSRDTNIDKTLVNKGRSRRVS
jgi:hypothetical protein